MGRGKEAMKKWAFMSFTNSLERLLHFVRKIPVPIMLERGHKKLSTLSPLRKVIKKKMPLKH